MLDPVSNRTYATAAAGQAEDVDAAVAAARRAFTEGPWPGSPPRARARVLNRIADPWSPGTTRLAELETFDTGLPITQALGQAQRAAENFRFFADLIVAQTDDAYRVPGRQINYVNRKPVGRRGADHAVEHPVHAGVLEARPRDRGGLHRGAQARGVHTALGEPVGGDLH